MDDAFSLSRVLQTVEKTASGADFHCRVDSRFAGFDGHFRGMPVVPGVCQIHWVFEAVARLTGAPFPCPELARMKFHNLLVPDTSFVISIERGKGGWQYRLHQNGQIFASGKLMGR